MKKITTEKGSNYNIDKAIFIRNESNYFNNGGFFTGFTEAFIEIAKNENLQKNDMKLLFLLFGYLGDPQMKVSPNSQKLLTQNKYAQALKIPQQRISFSFKKLEDFGYIKRNKNEQSIEILINPNVAYNGRTKDFTKIWNESAELFGNEIKKVEEIKEIKEQQNWDSSISISNIPK